MKRSILLFISLAFALILFVIFLPESQSSGATPTFAKILFAIFMLFIGGVFLYVHHEKKDGGSAVLSEKTTIKSEWGRTIFASLGVSIALSLIMLMFALLIFDYEVVVKYLRQHFLKHLLVTQLICIPFVKRFLK
jgi:hypothetical protein